MLTPARYQARHWRNISEGEQQKPASPVSHGTFWRRSLLITELPGIALQWTHTTKKRGWCSMGLWDGIVEVSSGQGGQGTPPLNWDLKKADHSVQKGERFMTLPWTGTTQRTRQADESTFVRFLWTEVFAEPTDKATCGCRVSTPALVGMALSEKNTIWYLQEDQPAGCGSWSFRGLRVPSLLRVPSARKWMHKYYYYISRFASS